MLDKPEAAIRVWAGGDGISPGLKHMGGYAVLHLGNPDMSPAESSELAQHIKTLSMFRASDPLLYAKHFSATDAARIADYNRQVNVQGRDPYAVRTQQQIAAQKRDDGTFVPVPEDILTQGVEAAMTELTREQGDTSWNPFRHVAGVGLAVGSFAGRSAIELGKAVIPGQDADAGAPFESASDSYLDMTRHDPLFDNDVRVQVKNSYELAFGMNGGNAELAQEEAIAYANQTSTVIGGRSVANGAVLDKTTQAAAGVTFDRFLEGVDNHLPTQEEITKMGFVQGATLSNPNNQILVDPDGKGVTITMPKVDGTSGSVRILTPTSSDQILPTWAGNRLQDMKDALSSMHFGTTAVGDAASNVPDESLDIK
jgi:hypothetical protein